ncbi:hypothetical protein [Rhodococcus gannanensis]|uniref:Signal transduction histidine kinase n=1 Tax=Rhodococcus gannanensis TaxID=1960308 RepID=A0ABW4P998_9NOCA
MTGHDGDVRELLGFRTGAARVLVVAYVLTFLLLALVTAPGRDAWWAELLAWVVVSVGAVTVVFHPSDPLPLKVGVALTLTGPMAVNLVLAVVPVPIDTLLLTWPLGASTAVYTYMCVRGRTGWAWLGMTLTLASCVLWAHRTGQGAGYGLAMSVLNLAPLVMSTFFAWTIRPAARNIYALRAQKTVEVAADAADLAVLEERDRQVRRLDELARPLLEHIASGAELSDATCTDCRLLEAYLRDTLRAPILSEPVVVTAARAARARGVEVILLDDHGMDDAAVETRDNVLGSVAVLLDAASSGTLTVRVLPPRRAALVTVLHDDDHDVRRIELGHDGSPLVLSARPA